MKGSVYFPNLTFEYDSLSVDFGCILNNLEAVRYLTVTNLSPMVVNYRWSFEANEHNGEVAVFHTDPVSQSFNQLLHQTSDLVSAAMDDGTQGYLVSTISKLLHALHMISKKSVHLFIFLNNLI